MVFDLQQINNKNLLDIVKHLCKKIGERVSGSESEAEAANYIAKQLESIGIKETKIKSYPHKYYTSSEAVIQHLQSGNVVTGAPIWMTKSTPLEGVQGEGLYLGSINQIEQVALDTVKDKIVFVFFLRDYLEPEIFGNLKNLYKLKPKAVILLSTYNTEVVRSDPIFSETSIFNQIPTMVIPAAKFAEYGYLKLKGEFKVSIKGRIQEGLLHNVISLQDGEITDTIVICAHHDTVENSQGAISNATGIALLIELAKIISQNKTKFSYVFASIGGEEQNLEGVKYFLEDYYRSKVALCINIDSLEPFPGFVASIVAGNKELYDIVQDIGKTNRFPAMSVNSTPNEGMNMYFAQEGIPSIMILFKGSISKGLNRTEQDNFKLVSEKSLEETGNYLLRLINKLETLEDLNFAEGIPPNLEKETKNYFDRMKFYLES